jgi:hypothetical protein
MKYKLAIQNFFKKLNLEKINWDIKASDDTIHSFSNLDIINSLNNAPEHSLKPILKTLEQQNDNIIGINNILKQIAKSYCDNRLFLIQALLDDYKKANTLKLRKHFQNLIDKFTESDLKEAGIYEEWQQIKNQKIDHNFQLTPTWE